MDIFLRLSRSGSFTAVATQLNQSPAAVARHINALENHLGVRLLNRSTRSISLTDAGKAYAELCGRVVDDITRCEAGLSAAQKEPSGSIKIIAPKTFGSMQLGDAIVAFGQQHPNIAISILLEEFSSGPREFVDRGYDVAMCWGADIRDSTLILSQLGNLTRKICAAPKYLGQHPALEVPTDLERHNCLIHLGAYMDSIWRFMDREHEVGVNINGDFASDSALMLRKAALAGRGIAMLPLYCVQDDLRTGTLVELLPGHPVPRTPFSILYRERRLLPSRVRLFIDFLRDWFGRQDGEL